MMNYQEFKNFLLQFEDFSEEELQEMYEAEKIAERDLQEGGRYGKTNIAVCNSYRERSSSKSWKERVVHS